MLERRLASKYEPFEVDLGSHVSAVAESLSFDSQGPKLRTVEQTRITKAATALSIGHINHLNNDNRQVNDKAGVTKERGMEDLDIDSVVTPAGPTRPAPPGTEVKMVRALCITFTTVTVEKLPLGTSLTLPQGEGWVYDDRGHISMRVQDNPSPQLGLDDEEAVLGGGGSVTLASGDDVKIQSSVHVELICPYIAFAPVTQENVDNHSDDDDNDDDNVEEAGRVTHRSSRSSPVKKSNNSDDDHDGDFVSNPSHSKKSGGGGVAGSILDHMDKFLSKANMKELRKKTGLTTKELAEMGFKLGETESSYYFTERLND